MVFIYESEMITLNKEVAIRKLICNKQNISATHAVGITI